ncbi:DNA mismatch repair endonuclease MutL [uncultured Faecalibaculum sp.]|uniref:DNA mismatch repair endonuclease MutL n=1 Tax=uncultured Faecalibaculum sp. TaxID=1729681 RepID=UPI0025D63E26|nr:DNA mismatch repair endonuclease MutL [uncultured Faecalibaculum sp.]
MAKIQVLDEHLTNMIAAGEVVERPANIVKECVENSLDAQAHSISVEVFEGGITKVIIEDDGIGMDPEDAELAFCRHATSKLRTEDDLFNISTMGFRGEALPSIASVADVVLQTDDGETGTRLHYSYGKLVSRETGRFPRGTRIEVSGLFVKTPARFKYLRRPAYEFSIISDIISKISLSHPEVRIRLSHDGRPVFNVAGSGSRQEILYQMYGRDVAAAAVAVDEKSEDFHITGYVIQPKISRASRHYMFVSVNGRIVRSRQMQDALIDAYSDYMPPGRYPIAVLDIAVDTQLVDVNVHPNKWEVRIAKQPQLIELIGQSVRKAFDLQLRTVEITPAAMETVAPGPNRFEKQTRELEKQGVFQSYEQSEKEEKEPVHKGAGGMSWHSSDQAAVPEARQENSISQGFFKPQEAPSLQPSLFAQPSDRMETQADTVSVSAPGQSPESGRSMRVAEPAGSADIDYPVPVTSRTEDTFHPRAQGKAFFHELRVIGQLRDSYILCEGPEGLVVIDQHAAQERYHYEQLREKIMHPDGRTQPLMVPLLLQAGPKVLAGLEDVNSRLQEHGLHFEAFGQNQVIVRELPVWMNDTDETAFLQDLLDQFESAELVDPAGLRKHITATMACHSSIRFNRGLTMQEMEQVVEDLQKCVQPYHCPHGRPTVITLSDAQLRREFERG